MLNFLTTWLTLQFCATSRPAAGSLLLTAGRTWTDRAALHALSPGFPREDWPAEPGKKEPPFPTDVPVPEPCDVPVPDPGKLPDPGKPRPAEKKPKPRTAP
jgi:hypothetical protein